MFTTTPAYMFAPFCCQSAWEEAAPCQGRFGFCQITFDSSGKIWSAGFYASSTDIVLLIIHLTDLYVHPTGKITGDLGRLGMGQLGIPQCTSPTCNSSTNKLNEDVQTSHFFQNYIAAYRTCLQSHLRICAIQFVLVSINIYVIPTEILCAQPSIPVSLSLFLSLIVKWLKLKSWWYIDAKTAKRGTFSSGCSCFLWERSAGASCGSLCLHLSAAL